MTSSSPVIVWYRNDLRVADHPALAEAASLGAPVIALYILDDETPGDRKPGGAARWWLHGSLKALSAQLSELGCDLVLRRGVAADVLQEIVSETDATHVFWNRCYEPFSIERDRAIKASLKEGGVDAKSFNGSLLFEPWTIETKAGGFYKVYTRFWHACRDKGDPEAPRPAPDKITPYQTSLASDDLDVWKLLPTSPDWAGGFRDRWRPGEVGAIARLEDFLDTALDDYAAGRDFPADAVTSNLSPHLHIGDISPRQIWQMTIDKAGWTAATGKFLKEIVWREFAYHVFYHLPSIADQPMNERFAAFPWRDDPKQLKAWRQGRTGYPMVDAGMRELWQTGHMHNRVRMVTASFLVKHLLLPWQMGEQWFWDTLVDADMAVNTFSWQWVAGSGADAAPYFRIFNPITQGSKFDPTADYIRKYVPEIAGLPDKHIHAPWEAPDDVLKEAGIDLDDTYPRPIVDHKRARERALEAFKSLPKKDAD